VRAPQAWAHWRDGAKVQTCIVDTGVMVSGVGWGGGLERGRQWPAQQATISSVRVTGKARCIGACV
jgi:hypothetical protein